MRLTKDMKTRIIKRAMLAGSFAKQLKDLESKKAEWAEKARIDSLGGPAAEAKLVAFIANVEEQVKCLPPQVQRLTQHQSICDANSLISAQIGGHTYIEAAFSGACAGGSYNTSFYNRGIFKRPDRVYKYGPKNTHIIPEEHKLAKSWLEIEEIERSLSEAADDAYRKVCGIVNSVNSDKTLLQIWPESKELLDGLTTPRVMLPTIRVEDLNAALGLPTETEAA